MKTTTLIITALGLAFFQGMATVIGLPMLEYQLLIDLVVTVLFILALLNRSNKIIAPAIGLFLAFSFIFLLSGIINNSDFFISYRMYRNTMIPYLLFLAVVNLPIKGSGVEKINMFLFVMLFVQILVSIVKYISFGVREGGIIGTFGTSAGAMSTIFPLLSILFLMFLYLIYDRNKIYLFLMAGFLFMSWGGGKRAIVFILPVMIIIAYMVYRKMEYNIPVFSLANTYKIVPVTVILIPVLYFGAIYTPTLNPERQYGGSFDMEHILDYASSYHLDERQIYAPSRYGEQALMHGRVATTIYAIELTNTDAKRFLTGFGPSSIYATARGDDILLNFGVVAFQTGISNYIISIGMPGAILLVLFYMLIFIKSLKYYEYFTPYWRAVILGIFMCFFVFLFDYFNYSSSFIHGLVPNMILFYLAGAVINKQQLVRKNII